MEQGKVKWFDDQKGYGFIEQDVGDDLFVHYSDIQQEGYKTLSEDQVVEFEIEETEKGLAAKNVTLVDDEASDETETSETVTETEEASDDETEGFGEGGFDDSDFGGDIEEDVEEEEETEGFGIDEEI